MSNKINQILALGSCAFFLACSAPTNERGIASTTNDKTASGSAYKSYDGFAPNASPAPAQAPVASPTAPVGAPDSTVAATTPAVTPAGTAAPAAAAPVATAKPAVADDSADIKKGEALISKSDCLACHKVDGKLVGPSYKEVANKYPNNAATLSQLADKIKKGGSGVWGAMPMTPHPTLSDDDAKAMVKYVLSLK